MILQSALLLMTLAAGLFVAEPPAPSVPAATPPTSADKAACAELLSKVTAAYQALDSYEDGGDVATVFTGGLQREDTLSFITRFTKARQFYHESYDPKDLPGSRHAIWTGDGKPKSWWAFSEIIDAPASLRQAFTKSSAVTKASSEKIPTLLIEPDIKQTFLRRLLDGRPLEDESLDGLTCKRIEWTAPYPTMDPFPGLPGGQSRTDSITVWIGKDDSLIRKVVEKNTYTGRKKDNSPLEFQTTVTTSFKPVANPTLPPDSFKFTPSKVFTQFDTRSKRGTVPRK
jgi:hypothetical protein